MREECKNLGTQGLHQTHLVHF